MVHRVTATEAARSFSELLNRVRYQGDSFVIVRNTEEVARLVPVSKGRPHSLRDLVDSLRAHGSPDPEFFTDLEAIRRNPPPLPGDPWES